MKKYYREKTAEDMLRKAVSIANNDPNACIGVFHNFLEPYNYENPWEGDGEYSLQSRTYKAKCGGIVLLFKTYKLDVCDLAGYQFTHVFCNDDLDAQQRNAIQNMIRCTHTPLHEPSGFFQSNGVKLITEMW